MVYVGMCWAVDLYDIETWLNEKYKTKMVDVWQCANGHKHKGKFCSECGTPITKTEKEVPNTDFDMWDFLSTGDFKFNEENTNIYYPLQNLRGDYWGFNEETIKKFSDLYIKEVSKLIPEIKEFVDFLDSKDEKELCIFDDGYYSREWPTY